MEISTIQDGGHNRNGGPDMAYSKFGPNMNCDELELVYWKLYLQ